MTLTGTILPVLMVAIGAGIVVRTLTGGGGPLAFGVLVGVLFAAGGLLRLYVERRARP